MSKPATGWSRYTRIGASGIVAGIAGYASYWHQVTVAQMAGERADLAHIMPGSVDGLLVVASIAMVDARREGRKPSWQTKLAFGAGIAASVGANIMAAHPTWLSRAVAAWPAVALLLVVESLSSRGKKLKDAESPAPLESPKLPAAPVSPPVGMSAAVPAPAAPAAPKPRSKRSLQRDRTGDVRLNRVTTSK
jgi:hypothetical protein